MKRQIAVLLSVLSVLIAVIFSLRHAGDGNPTGAKRALFDLPEDGIAAVEINHFTQGFYFKKDGGDWTVKRVKTELANSIEKKNGGTPDDAAGKAVSKPQNAAETAETPEKADPVKLSSLLTNLETLEIGEPVATEKESVGQFQINPHSLHVILYGGDGKELGRLYVGKMGPDFMSSFVKKGDSDAVYLVDENLGGLMNYSYEDWLLPEQKDGGVAGAAKPDEPVKAVKKGSAHAASKNKKNR